MAYEPNEYLHDFAFVNKSYIKDLPWTVAMYRSWFRSNFNRCPFYIIVPNKDIDCFSKSFGHELKAGLIGWLPILIGEESFFQSLEIEIPSEFDGWRIQQIVKLAFAKTGYARNYLTVDSSILFDRPISPTEFLLDGMMCCAAEPTTKSEFFGNLRQIGELGWLDGKLVNLSKSFEKMCELLGNTSENTNAYISCTGMFNSNLSKKLECFALENDLQGYVGLLQIAPYEFAWYGEFVYTKNFEQFRPRSPHIMTLASSEQDAKAVESGNFRILNHHFGIMFQPPAAHLLDPNQVDDLLVKGVFR